MDLSSQVIKFWSILLIINMVWFVGCQVGVHKDLTSGLTYNYHGLGVDEVFLTINGEAIRGNQFTAGSTVVMNFKGVSGFTNQNDKVYPGLSVKVTDPEGTVLLAAEDLFSQYDETGLDIDQAGELSSNLTIGDPMQVGKSYLWHISIWDKQHDGLIEANLNFNVQP